MIIATRRLIFKVDACLPGTGAFTSRLICEDDPYWVTRFHIPWPYTKKPD